MRELHRTDIEEVSSALLQPAERSWPKQRSDGPGCWGRRLSLARTLAASGALLLGAGGAGLLATLRAAQAGELRPNHSISAVEIPEGHHIVSVSQDLCLTRSNENSGSLITSTICDVNDMEQKWVFDGEMQHITTPSGKCLDDGGDFVHIWDCRYDNDRIKANQRWMFEDDKFLKNANGLCLHASINGGKVGFISCSDTADMHWRLSLAPPEEPVVPTQPVQPAQPAGQPALPEVPTTTPFPTQKPVQGKTLLLQGSFCLDSGGEAVHLWDCANATESQVWEQDENMHLRTHDGRCLDASSHTLETACDPGNRMQVWNVDQQTGHVYTMATGVHCLTTLGPMHSGDIVGLKECKPTLNELQWNVRPPTEAHMKEFRESHPKPHLDRLIVCIVPVLCVALVSLFLLLSCCRRKKAERTIIPPKSEPEGEEVDTFSEPHLTAVKINDPRPSTTKLHVGVVAFGFDGKDPWDELCGAPWLSNGYDLGPGGIQVEALGVTQNFCNAEAAFHALQFWALAADFSNLSAEQALEKKKSLSGREDFDYAGHGSKWRGMQAVLNAKFRTGSKLDKMLVATQDAFLLYHSGQKGLDRLWSDNSDGDGTNWVGMQLMLLREKRSGWKRWTSFIESCVSTTTGEVSQENSAWQDSVRAARNAVEVAIAAQRSQQQFEELRQEQELRQEELRRSGEEPAENNEDVEEEEGG